MKKESIVVHVYTEGSLPARFDAWIRRTLEYLVMEEVQSLARKKRRQAEMSMEDMPDLIIAADIFGRPAQSVSEAAEVWEEHDLECGGKSIIVHDEALARALRQLSPRRRQVLAEAFWGGNSSGEIAKKLGLAIQTVENHKCTALNQLRIWIKESDEEDE